MTGQNEPLSEEVLVAAEDLAVFRLQSVVRRAFALSGMTQQEIADRLGDNKKSEVSKILGRPQNLTTRRAARFLRAMNFLMEIEPRQVQPIVGERLALKETSFEARDLNTYRIRYMGTGARGSETKTKKLEMASTNDPAR